MPGPGRGGSVRRLIKERMTAIIDGYATTGSGNYAAAARCGELMM
jgi:hypothetical protein